MNPNIQNALLNIQEQLFNSKGVRTDILYEEGKGAIIFNEGSQMIPQNAIVAIPEHMLYFGNGIRFNFA
jgi:hypothetical protein